LNNQIQQLVYSKNKITQQEPDHILSTQKDVAILFHVFYIDVWQEIKAYLDQLTISYDLYVTVPGSMKDEDIVRIFKDHADVNLYKTENRGRDVLPFLQVMNIIGTQTYQYICKLHTKKTGDSPLGNVWRKMLYFDLLGSNNTVQDILALFENDPDIGMVTGKNTILDSERYDYGNTAKIDKLVDKAGFLFQDEYLFAGGTMFWVRSELLEPVMKLYKSGELEFEEEKGQKDNTIAHAIERFFGIICHVSNKKIVESPSKYSELDDDTLNEVSALILSQQYVGNDVFLSQKQELQKFRASMEFKEEEFKKMEEEIKQLNELAQSLRIKSRVKRLIPNKIISIPRKTLQIIRTMQKNPAIFAKVLYYLKRGEIRYLLSKIKEKSGRNLAKTAKLLKIDPLEYFKRFKQKNYSTNDITIDIIIPVYNGYEYLEALFDSLEEYTTSPHRLIVVNDCSPDERVKPYLLKRLKKYPTALFIDHENNQGFVKSVNEACRHTSNHFLILNTDTEVPAFWMERLMYPIIHMEKVASTTPFTNSGQIASFPNFIADNEIFEGMKVNALDKVFRNVNAQNFYEEIPTGVGFCMGVNYDLVQEIGFFEEEEFGKGYGEENDWCQRAIQNGYRNLLVPNLFVYHKHGGSFSMEEKEHLMKENAIKLLNKHPDYDKDIQKYVHADPHFNLRKILVIVASSKHEEGIHLVVDHTLGGGANLYATELIESVVKEGKKILHLTFDFYSNSYNFYFKYKTYEFDFSIPDIEGVETFLRELSFKEIFVNSLVSFKETARMLALIKELTEVSNAQLVIPIHDYYPVCPNYTLLNEQSEFCEVPSLERCQSCMQQNDLEWKTFGNGNANVSVWRNDWKALLDTATKIICFSNSSKEILKRAYSDLENKKIVVIPHTVKALPVVFSEKHEAKEEITIGILGAINLAKGAGILKDLVKIIEERDLKINIVLIGEISEYIKSEHFHVSGRYEREALPELIKEHEIDIFLIPSICPETFSYTTQEIMMMDMPLMVFDLGAPAERVKEYEKGIVLEKDYVENIIKMVVEFDAK